MIILTPLLTPKQLYKTLYRLVRSNISMYYGFPTLSTLKTTQLFISDTIDSFIKQECYPYPTFAKQLRRYFLAYRHTHLGRVTPN